MISLGLSPSEEALYLDALIYSHRIRITVTVLDRDEKEIGSLTAPIQRVLAGAVNVDTSQIISRMMRIQVMDPQGLLYLDPAVGAHSEALFLDRFVSIKYGVEVPTVGWVDCPVFQGPITRVERQHPVVSVEGIGKESMWLAPAETWSALSFPAGNKVTEIIKDILSSKGQIRWKIPQWGFKTTKITSLPSLSEGWRVIRRLAKDIDRQAYFQGDGRFRLRQRPDTPVYTFYSGSRSGGVQQVTSKPVVTSDYTTLRNTVEVLGPQPTTQGGKRIRAVATPPSNDPLSPASLAHNGAPRHLVERVESSVLLSQDEADEMAKNILTRMMVVESDARFESLVIPFLEEDDKIKLVTDDAEFYPRMRQFSIPLSSGETMSHGFLKRNRLRRRTG